MTEGWRRTTTASRRGHILRGHVLCQFLCKLLLLPQGLNPLFLPRFQRAFWAKVAEPTLCTQSAAVSLCKVVRTRLTLAPNVLLLMLRPLRLKGVVHHVWRCRAHPGHP